MKFFMPYAADDAQAEELYQALKKGAAKNTNFIIGTRRIFGISYHYGGKDQYDEVGKEHERLGEIVFAIFEAAPVVGAVIYLICLPNHGVARGVPMMVGRYAVKSITNFQG
jgi:hypothetical protein